MVDAIAQPPPYSGGISEAIMYSSMPELLRKALLLKGERRGLKGVMWSLLDERYLEERPLLVELKKKDR